MERVTVDHSGILVAVNDAWTDYTISNNGDPLLTGVGMSYLEVCDAQDDEQSANMGHALRDALQGNTPDPIVIACHPPNSVRWFTVTVAPTDEPQGGAIIELAPKVRNPTDPRPPQPPTPELLKGSKCTAAFSLNDAENSVLHEGCPGWWEDHSKDSGWPCACPCHEERFGWPAWEESPTGKTS